MVVKVASLRMAQELCVQTTIDQPMPRLLAILLALQLLVGLAAQEERRATVRLDDGMELQGTVVELDLRQLQLRTDRGVVTIPAVRILKFSFEPAEQAQAESEPAKALTAPVTSPAAPVTAAPAAEPVPKVAPAVQDKGQQPAAAPVPPPAAPAGETAAKQAPETIDAEPTVSPRIHWQARLRALGASYTWLLPDGAAQWVSIGLLLFLTLSLSIYSSVRLASGEIVEFTRCTVLSAWFLVTGFVQVALVPSGPFAAAVMLLANPAMALFWLRLLFGLSRSAAVVAFTIQLGFLVVSYGVLNLLDSILASVQTPVT